MINDETYTAGSMKCVADNREMAWMMILISSEYDHRVTNEWTRATSRIVKNCFVHFGGQTVYDPEKQENELR